MKTNRLVIAAAQMKFRAAMADNTRHYATFKMGAAEADALIV